MEFVPCPCKHHIFCCCLTEEQNENQLFLKHVESSCQRHKNFKQNGLFSVSHRPAWKFNCHLTLSPEEIYFVDYLSDIFGLRCSCHSRELCKLCRHLCPYKSSVPPVLFLDNFNSLSLKHIKLLAPALKYKKDIQLQDFVHSQIQA